MGLVWATWASAFFCFGLGALFGWRRLRGLDVALGLLRNTWVGLVFFGGALAWFLWKVLHLGAADFGAYRFIFFVFFGGAGLAAFFYIPDFLCVRGFAALLLLCGQKILEFSYMEYHLPQRLLLVGMVYAGFSLAFYLAAYPYRLRDFLEWSKASVAGSYCVVFGFTASGFALSMVALSY